MESVQTEARFICPRRNSFTAYRRFWSPTLKNDVLAIVMRFEGSCWAFGLVFVVGFTGWLSAF